MLLKGRDDLPKIPFRWLHPVWVNFRLWILEAPFRNICILHKKQCASNLLRFCHQNTVSHQEARTEEWERSILDLPHEVAVWTCVCCGEGDFLPAALVVACISDISQLQRGWHLSFFFFLSYFTSWTYRVWSYYEKRQRVSWKLSSKVNVL